MSLALSVLAYGSAALAVAAVALYLYLTRHFGHWRRLGVKELPPKPFVGNMADVALGRRNVGAALADIYRRHRHEPYLGIYSFDTPVLQVHDLDIIKSVLVKDGQNFVNRSLSASEKTEPLAAKSLFGLKGERWKAARNAISPSFTSGKLKRMHELVVGCGKMLVGTVNKHAGKPVQVYEVAARYTTDSIATCAFGIEGNALADEEAEFRKKLRLFFEFSFVRNLLMAMSFFTPKIVEILGLFGVQLMPREGIKFVKDTITTTVAHRENHGIQRGDFLDSLIELRKDESLKNVKQPAAKVSLEDVDLLAHSMAFLTAGFETSATTISYALYELAKDQEVQGRLRREVKEALDGADALSYEALHGLKYMDMVLKEVLRMYPPLPNLDRKNVKPYTIPGTDITLKPGSVIAIPLHAIQMDPEFFPNPNKFDPERFSDENKSKIINYSYMPFGEGPRNCAGMRFAVMQVKAGIADVLSRFSVHPCPDTPEEIEFSPQTFLLQPKKPINICFKQL